ncbi:MAG: carcinine hydrolase/isopenicillin-N N-acyltransferase family protein [Pseudomonadales bacterium]
MCTTGAIVLAENDWLLFKNKDFSKASFSDELMLETALFGVRGTESFSEENAEGEVFSGLSIGANRYGLLCCDSHVSFIPSNGQNYDKLVEIALRQGRNVESAISALAAHLQAQPSWAGNLVLVDGAQVARVEASGCELRVEYGAASIASTNHQYLFSNVATAAASSAERLQSATERLAQAESVSDIFALLASHDRGEMGVCNHQTELRTVYSYILRCKDGRLRLYVHNGLPCEGQRYHEFELPLGQRWSEQAARELNDSYPR